MGRVSCITHVGPKCHHTCPCKRQAEGARCYPADFEVDKGSQEQDAESGAGKGKRMDSPPESGGWGWSSALRL